MNDFDRAKLPLGCRAALGIAGALSLAACPPATPRAPSPSPLAAGWSYEILVATGGEALAVNAVFPIGTESTFAVIDGAQEILRDVRAFDFDGGSIAVAEREGMWSLATCARGCRVQYSARLGDAARTHQSRTLASTLGRAIEAPVSTWLLRPRYAPAGTHYALHVATAPGESFVTGLTTIDRATGQYEGHTTDDFLAPMAVFGRVCTVPEHSGRVIAATSCGGMTEEPAVGTWIDEAVTAVESYVGPLPAAPVFLFVDPVDGDEVGFGSAMRWGGAMVDVAVGRNTTRATLHGDWTLTHELVHTAFPRLDDDQHWFEEGLATYVEPLARARVGLTTPTKVWSDWVERMPNGLPKAGDEGLDRTHTWGRTYWGGALFCLLADIEIRERTGNERSLEDALRAVIAAGGTIQQDWSMEHLIDVGDASTGVTVLRDLYTRMGKEPGATDLEALWTRLGVVKEGESVTFDDGASLARVRRAMTERR